VVAVTRAPDFDVIVLAGGSAVRMGGTDKLALAVDGTPMLVSVAQAAAAAGTRRLILVGPPRPGPIHDALTALAARQIGSLVWVQEEPAGIGPLAGLRRGLAEATAPWLVLLAADLPFLSAAHLTDLLMAAQRPAKDLDGVVSADATGHLQWLTSCWRTGALRSALAAYTGDSLGGVLGPMNSATIRLAPTAGAPPPWLDCDTPEDLATARHASTERAENPGG
jgi:molybdopterin-guanine dinucleotide biosynthesis protein A